MVAARLAALLSPCLLVAGALAPTLPAGAQEHHHHATAAPAGTANVEFTADATLSREMAAIRTGLATHLAQDGDGQGDVSANAALGRNLEARIGTIIRECRLPQDADAVLHGYLARMLIAAGTLQRADATASARHSAVQAAVRAYDDYGARFTDPAWKALAAE